ncbi:hypothetical protein DFP72DRAFT_1041544 [Ephemerocybe angulata]|uniref:Lipid droplet-associated perilipin protein n=1 Tax=Ephemerocybe angulata TaxID=980116 RepID=A0A8H6MBC6_9AGAR|nr:hypothetical protein DFP72DRAFT_1041544 [Tulosesus angulatus]
MSATATETQQAPAESQAPPALSILTRVASIPMIHSGLETLTGTLSKNSYTRSTYNTAVELSTSAYKLTEPLQIKLAPLIVRADDYANKAVDAVESRYPYPFKVKPEDVAALVSERKQSASEYVHGRLGEANKTLDEKVKNPAFTVAQDLDQRLAPFLNYFESTVTKLNPSEAGPSSPDAQYQYQRALALSKTLKDNVYEYTSEQLKHIQAQSVIIQRASETAQSINSLASSSFTSAQGRVHALSENMLAELQKLQSQTNALSTSIQSSIQTSKSQLQTQLGPQIQQTYSELSTVFSTTIADLNEILRKKDTPLPDKVGLVGKEVRERVSPLLDAVKKGFAEILARGKEFASQPSSPTSEKKAEKDKPESTPEEFPGLPTPGEDPQEPAASLKESVAAEATA